MTGYLVLPVPDRPALDRAVAAFRTLHTASAEAELAAALEDFTRRAQLMVTLVTHLTGKPCSS